MLVAISERNSSDQSRWHLFNDFLVRQVATEEALHFAASWKNPVILTYQISTARHALDDSWKKSLDTACLYYNWPMKFELLHPQTGLTPRTY